jgi:hypothetical protein
LDISLFDNRIIGILTHPHKCKPGWSATGHWGRKHRRN